MAMPRPHEFVPPLRSHRRGFFLADALVAMAIIMLLTLVLTVSVTRQQRTTAKLADTRDAVRLAEQTLTALQAGEPAPAPPEGSVVEIRPAGPLKDAANLSWVSVHVTHRGRSAMLIGVAPAASAHPAHPAPATQGAAK